MGQLYLVQQPSSDSETRTCRTPEVLMRCDVTGFENPEYLLTAARREGMSNKLCDHVARTVEVHFDVILEYVGTRSTNARNEGLNGKIRTITRRSYGFHSARSLIAMIFLCCGGVHVTPAFSGPLGFH